MATQSEMRSNRPSGRLLALEALEGRSTEAVAVGPLTWGFDYSWLVADLQPWQLACGSEQMWHHAHLSMLQRHEPDLLFYHGSGSGTQDPVLESEDADTWEVRDGNTGVVYGLNKTSLTLYEIETGRKDCDPVGEIATVDDVEGLVPEPAGWGERYLRGLTRLVSEVGDRALVLPHDSPGYIKACYAFGFEAAMRAMILDPALFLAAADRYASGDVLRMSELKQAGAQAVWIADGWASADIISPEMFTRFALPYQRRIVEAARGVGLRAILWNEGDVLPFLEAERELPIDGFAVEQFRKGVDLRISEIRRVFGPERCLFGNLDSEHLLARAAPQEIKTAVRQMMSESGEDTPFIMTTGSPLPSATPPAAVDAMIAGVREYAW